jgi:hypothetical protein
MTGGGNRWSKQVHWFYVKKGHWQPVAAGNILKQELECLRVLVVS